MLDWFKKLLEVKRAASIKPQPKAAEPPPVKEKRKVKAIGGKLGPTKPGPKGKGIKKK
jgi:hypothetical protein